MFKERESGAVQAVNDFWPVCERNTVSKAIFTLTLLNSRVERPSRVI
jgi:hypothetical protein